MYSLKCNISLEVNHLSEGISLALKDDREKNSEALGRPAMYVGESRITKCAKPHLSAKPNLDVILVSTRAGHQRYIPSSWQSTFGTVGLAGWDCCCFRCTE